MRPHPLRLRASLLLAVLVFATPAWSADPVHKENVELTAGKTASRWRVHGAGVFDAQRGAQECGGQLQPGDGLARLGKKVAKAVDAGRITAPLGIVDMNITDVRMTE